MNNESDIEQLIKDAKAIAKVLKDFQADLRIQLNDLAPIDSIAKAGIAEGAYPGCQVLVAKSGKVIYNKSFGYHTYAKKRAVLNSDIYDIASIYSIVDL